MGNLCSFYLLGALIRSKAVTNRIFSSETTIYIFLDARSTCPELPSNISTIVLNSPKLKNYGWKNYKLFSPITFNERGCYYELLCPSVSILVYMSVSNGVNNYKISSFQSYVTETILEYKSGMIAKLLRTLKLVEALDR